jgi:hypothetical protein
MHPLTKAWPLALLLSALFPQRWCARQDDPEPLKLCAVWDLYHGDTAQYPKILPADRPSPASVQSMHADYCRAGGASSAHAAADV